MAPPVPPARHIALVAAFCLAAIPASGVAYGDGLPYPAGASSHKIEDLQTELVLPRDLSAEKKGSLVVILHGVGGTATGMAGALADWANHGYVVCAPKSTGQAWNDADVEAVKRIAAHLLAVLPIDPEKVHVVGFSNGGWNLPPLAFDEKLRPISATWVAAGCKGGSVPDSQKSRMGVLAMAGAQDANLASARDTVKILAGKVRSVEVRVQPNLGHEWPDALMPYFQWWMGVQEGRFVPGEDRNFAWTADLAAAKAAVAGKKKGGVLLYVFDPTDEKPEAKALQNEVFFDPEVRRLGAQLQVVKRARADVGAEEAALIGFTVTPFVAVFDTKGVLKQAIEGKVKASALAKALRSVAPEPREPK
jgi:poly(3-hydroxybutyrate) depolymerase